MLRPLMSFIDFTGLSALTYQKRSGAPVICALTILSGAPLETAPITPRMPFAIATSALLVITACSVSAPPRVQVISICRPSRLKIPASTPCEMNRVSKLPRWPTAARTVSCASAPPAQAASASPIP